MPRTIDDILRNELVKKAKPGDKYNFIGTLNLSIKDLSYKLIFIADNVMFLTEAGFTIGISENDKINNSPKKSELDKIIQMKIDQNIYMNLSKEISPSVFGHDEAKKGLLLMLFGGVNKETQEGIKLCGDINICLVGDPCSKKQLNSKNSIHQWKRQLRCLAYSSCKKKIQRLGNFVSKLAY